MASGVEIAGLVLGSIPLIISALEHYAEGVETVEKWWRYKRELANLKRILGAEYDRFLNTLEELLAGLVPDGVLADLLNSPGGAAWANPDLNRKLQARLQKSFNSYLDTVNDLNDVVSILKAKLELDPSGKLKWTDSKTFRREYKRIKFSLSKASYEELMKRIEKDNDTLANLTGQSLRLEPTRQRRNNPTPEFERTRSQAESLYRVLKKTLCHSCQTPHNASLRLEARIPQETEAGMKRFKMVFGFDKSHPIQDSNSWKRRETEIESWDICQETETSTKIISLESPLSSPKLPKKGVTWGPVPVALEPPPYTLTAQTETEIHDLCLAFNNYEGTETCLGFILDEKLMRHHVYLLTHGPTNQEPPNATTLYKRLKNSPPSSKTNLTRKERLQLALTLAASVLQLHKTPWMSERWSTDDILFLEGNTEPHISRSFHTTPLTDPPDTLKPHPLPIVRNQTIFALGVILIELCLGASLASLRIEEDLSPDEQLTDYMTARRLISQVYDESGGRYGDAVRRCIHCEFDQRTASLDVEAFRTSFFQGVVVPLEEDWSDFCRYWQANPY